MTIVVEQLQIILLFGSLTLLAHWIAKKQGFFSLSADREEGSPPLRGMQVIAAFAIYLIVSLAIAPMAARMFAAAYVKTDSFSYIVFVQLFALALILLSLALYTASQNRALMRTIWIRGEATKKRIASDFLFGVITWLVAFPLVVTVAQICDLLLYLLLGVESYEQSAVRFLKMSLNSPSLLAAALVTVLCAAPIIEEWLFRGFLQTFFRKHLGVKAAILLSALCFALFHLSFSQGWGNISLALSLFVFACYLGFIYERQKSLFAPIGLHMTFNLVSALRILFGPEA